MLAPGRYGRDVAGHASQNHRQPEEDALKVLVGGRFGAQGQVGEVPPAPECTYGLERKGDTLPLQSQIEYYH